MIYITAKEYYELGGDDNELLGKFWTEKGWRYTRSIDGAWLLELRPEDRDEIIDYLCDNTTFVGLVGDDEVIFQQF